MISHQTKIMGSEKTIKGETVIQYLEKYTDLPTNSLAKIVYSDNPILFKSKEDARVLIRYYRGALGSRMRKGLTDRRFIREQQSIQEVMKSFRLDPEEEPDSDYVLEGVHTIGLLSDTHIPYHNYQAVETCLEYFDKKKIDCLVLNGDIVDFYQASTFVRDPRKRSLADEIEMAREFMLFLRACFPDIRIIYKEGNHEERWEKFMYIKAPELIGVHQFELTEVFDLENAGIEFVKGRKKIVAGAMNIIHGHEFGRSVFNPVNPARGLFLRAKTNAICGHYHQTSSHHENNLDEDQIATWSTGCLCSLKPEYSPLAFVKWNHGAAILEIGENSYKVNNFRVINGKVR